MPTRGELMPAVGGVVGGGNGARYHKVCSARGSVQLNPLGRRKHVCSGGCSTVRVSPPYPCVPLNNARKPSCRTVSLRQCRGPRKLAFRLSSTCNRTLGIP